MTQDTTPLEENNTNYTWLIVGGSVILVGGLGYLGYRWWKSRNKPIRPHIAAKTRPRVSSSRPPWCQSKSYPLEYKTCHPDVKWLQTYLKQKFGADLGTYGPTKNGIDGKFGNATKAAALRYLSTTSFTQQDIAKLKANAART